MMNDYVNAFEIVPAINEDGTSKWVLWISTYKYKDDKLSMDGSSACTKIAESQNKQLLIEAIEHLNKLPEYHFFQNMKRIDIPSNDLAQKDSTE